MTGTEAKSLRVRVIRGGATKVDLTFPARSARWLLEIMPSDVIERIRASGFAIDEMQRDLAEAKALQPRKLVELSEPDRQVQVWLE